MYTTRVKMKIKNIIVGNIFCTLACRIQWSINYRHFFFSGMCMLHTFFLFYSVSFFAFLSFSVHCSHFKIVKLYSSAIQLFFRVHIFFSSCCCFVQKYKSIIMIHNMLLYVLSDCVYVFCVHCNVFVRYFTMQYTLAPHTVPI